MAKRTVKHSWGIIEDIWVKVDKFIFPIDFIIMDLDEDVDVPLILGWPFLATSQALIDVKDVRLVLRVGKAEVVFKLPEAMKHSWEFDDTLCTFDESNEVSFDCA